MAKKITKEDMRIIAAIQKGTPREFVIKKYKITNKRYDELASFDTSVDADIDKAINKLTSNKNLLRAAAELNVEFIEELHGLQKLDENMQMLANDIINRLAVQVSECKSTSEMIMIIQGFVMMRKAMFAAGPQVQVNNFTSLPAITSSKA
jgi:hypothetical protein